MEPKTLPKQEEKYFFEYMTLKETCNKNHPLILLTNQMDWSRFDQSYGALYCVGTGRPAKPTRLLVALHYLEYTYNLSDEETVGRWLENPYWQYFSGEIIFQKDYPIEPSSMTRWRKRIGEERLKLFLAETIRIAQEGKVITPKEMNRVIVDTTVEERNILRFQRTRSSFIVQSSK